MIKNLRNSFLGRLTERLPLSVRLSLGAALHDSFLLRLTKRLASELRRLDRERAARHVGAERPERRARLALLRRQVLGARRGRQAGLHLGPEQAVCAHSRAALEDAPEAEGEGGEGEVRSAEASKSATPMPVKGQSR